ncbi:triacylglycerol lipase 2-like [Coffea eugenioides]|uniref:triacylglycerol lipase 2-like n=1 Tax=Coffea eugenioides TaxID=49369 RepID=UPI000F606814|nr:triacylglycerol lipase 2-like [Coffea eugenioides]
MYRGMNRFRGSGSSVYRYLTMPQMRRKVSNSWSAMQDTYFSTKDIFERHKVVFTMATSIASVATAWIGYSLRHFHETRVDQRLERIESAMKNKYEIGDPEFKKLVSSSVSIPACIATAGTTLFIGYGLGWRGGRWYALRKVRREQMKILGQVNSRQWPFKFLKAKLPLLARIRPRRWPVRILRRPRLAESAAKTSETTLWSIDALDGICNLMVETRGYKCEEHEVVTEDGYILNMQRIPFGLAGETPGKRPPVLLQHGLLMDAITWLLSPPDQSLALILADSGFDVWLVSSRGTKYSLSHETLSPDNAAYWDFTWDELAAYDLPASIQFVNDFTGQKLHYVGHSQVKFSPWWQLVDKLRSAALLSPIGFLGEMTSPLARIGVESFISQALYWLGINEFNPRGDAVIQLLMNICKNPGVDCTHLLTSFTGANCCMNSSIIDVFLRHEPQPTSTKNMIHLSQMVKGGTIQMYDYGNEDENNKHYGQPTPPVYNMKNIPKDFPLFLSHGGADALSDVKDVMHLVDNLKDHDKDKIVVQYIDNYAHADYVMGVNARETVYEPLMAFFRLY